MHVLQNYFGYKGLNSLGFQDNCDGITVFYKIYSRYNAIYRSFQCPSCLSHQVIDREIANTRKSEHEIVIIFKFLLQFVFDT